MWDNILYDIQKFRLFLSGITWKIFVIFCIIFFVFPFGPLFILCLYLYKYIFKYIFILLDMVAFQFKIDLSEDSYYYKTKKFFEFIIIDFWFDWLPKGVVKFIYFFSKRNLYKILFKFLVYLDTKFLIYINFLNVKFLNYDTLLTILNSNTINLLWCKMIFGYGNRTRYTVSNYAYLYYAFDCLSVRDFYFNVYILLVYMYRWPFKYLRRYYLNPLRYEMFKDRCIYTIKHFKLCFDMFKPVIIIIFTLTLTIFFINFIF